MQSALGANQMWWMYRLDWILIVTPMLVVLVMVLPPPVKALQSRWSFLWSFSPFSWFKGSIFLKNRASIIQERFNELIYGINTIIICGTWQYVKFQLVSRSWNEMIFLWYLWISVGNINSGLIKIISFLIQFKNERQTENFIGCQFMIVLILYISLSNLS